MKIAIVKQGGLCAGGIEKYLQQIAVELRKENCVVDYYYTESVPCSPDGTMHPGTDVGRKAFMESNDINLFEISCSHIDPLESGGMWHNSNFFEVFESNVYDAVVGGHKGEPCWPFSVIKGPRIIETVHGTDFTSGASTYSHKYVLISEYQTERWKRAGGDMLRTQVIAPMVAVDMSQAKNDRKKWGIPDNAFVFGLHQSSRQGLFSPVPLDAYAAVQGENNFFVILGGTAEYEQHAARLGLRNFLRIPPLSNSESINSVLSCFNVYSHGRSDGEVCSSAIIEAMAHDLPVITHPSSFNNGHLHQIDGCGFLAHSIQEYASFMKALEIDANLRKKIAEATSDKYNSHFSFERCRDKILKTVMLT
jgi:glycosyltransferase involved in cell wall biosynthesis